MDFAPFSPLRTRIGVLGCSGCEGPFATGFPWDRVGAGQRTAVPLAYPVLGLLDFDGR